MSTFNPKSIIIETPGEHGMERYIFPRDKHFIEKVIINVNAITVIELDTEGNRKPHGFRNYHRYETE